MKNIKWHFRNNKKRKIAKKNSGSHPSLVVGETDDGTAYVNIGLTKSSKRGHHKNIKIHNPQNWNEESYLRDDIRIDSKEYLKNLVYRGLEKRSEKYFKNKVYIDRIGNINLLK